MNAQFSFFLKELALAHLAVALNWQNIPWIFASAPLFLLFLLLLPCE